MLLIYNNNKKRKGLHIYLVSTMFLQLKSNSNLLISIISQTSDKGQTTSKMQQKHCLKKGTEYKAATVIQCWHFTQGQHKKISKQLKKSQF